MRRALDAWFVTDGFLQEWRARIVPFENRVPVSRWSLLDDPLAHLIPYAFDDFRILDEATARDLLDMYDVLTCDPPGPRRRLRGFKWELSETLYQAVEAGLLLFERHHTPWPFPDEDDVTDEPPPSTKRDESRVILRIWLLDENRQRMPRAPYRLRMGGQLRSRNADDQGLLEEFDMSLESECFLEWGSPPYRFSATLHTSPTDAQRLNNLGYDQLQQFQNDYGTATKVASVHENGIPANRVTLQR